MRTCLWIGMSAFLFCFPAALLSAQQNVPAPAIASAYTNTTEGLEQLLLDMRAAAKDRDHHKLAVLIKNTEIPNCDAWLHSMYDSDKADSWTGLCKAKSRDPREQDLKELFSRIGKQDGNFITRKVNDNPQPGKGLEWAWLRAVKQPLDIYWSDWLPANEADQAEADPIGYFMFIDGAFRWESGIRSFKPSQTKIINGKIVKPTLIKTVDPIYPPDAQNRVGTVRVYFVIGGDGLVYNAHAISGEGLSEDPSLRKAAEDAVLQWRYQPGTINGNPFQTTTTVDITFSSNH